MNDDEDEDSFMNVDEVNTESNRILRKRSAQESGQLDSTDNKSKSKKVGGTPPPPSMNNKQQLTITTNTEPATIKPISTVLFKNKTGPFGVWIKKIKPDDDELNAIRVGSFIFKNYKNVLDIKNRGKFKVEILFNNANEANRLLIDKEIAKHNLEPFIPGFRRNRKGIVKGVPLELSEEDILKGIPAEYNVTEVMRLKRRNKNSTNDDNKWLPSQTVKLTFEGQILPVEISLFFVKLKVTPYVQKPMVCLNCFKYGHLAKSCKGKTKCIMCAEETSTGHVCQCEVPKCANCSGPHKSIDSKCEVYKKYEWINKLMAHDNISFAEAKKFVIGEKQPPIKTKEQYPELKNPKKSTSSIQERIQTQTDFTSTHLQTQEYESTQNSQSSLFLQIK